MRSWILLVLGLAVAGCSEGGTEPERASMTGRWQGAAFGISADATLTESDRVISGSGTLTTPQGTIPTTITGRNQHPDVTLTIRAPGQPEGTFAGTFTDPNTVAGALTITGFPQVSLVLRRQ